jgi:hypothetical protein
MTRNFFELSVLLLTMSSRLAEFPCPTTDQYVSSVKGRWITPITGIPFTATQTITVTYSRRFSVYSWAANRICTLLELHYRVGTRDLYVICSKGIRVKIPPSLLASNGSIQIVTSSAFTFWSLMSAFDMSSFSKLGRGTSVQSGFSVCSSDITWTEEEAKKSQ